MKKEYYKEGKGIIQLGDSLNLMKDLPDESIDMIFTSPPYADRRKSVYGGVSSKEYIEWFIPYVKEIKRILKSTGSFFVNIKAHTNKGQRDLYVMKLVIYLVEYLELFFVDDFVWVKNAFPGKLNGRLKNGHEPVYHFTKEHPNKIIFNPLACGTPMKEESIARSYRKQCGPPKNGSGMTGMNTTNIRNLKTARPSNVINVNNVSNQFTDKQKHPATFPEGLSSFFIKTFSNVGDIVLDPFAGSGTTGLSCEKNDRFYILMDDKIEYVNLMKNRLGFN